jgi:hypothetical protein
LSSARLLDGLSEFPATRVFGSYHENLLDASLRAERAYLNDQYDHERQPARFCMVPPTGFEPVPPP